MKHVASKVLKALVVRKVWQACLNISGFVPMLICRFLSAHVVSRHGEHERGRTAQWNMGLPHARALSLVAFRDPQDTTEVAMEVRRCDRPATS
eukprot:9422553-Alexandrium_andersonii.AAC.1